MLAIRHAYSQLTMTHRTQLHHTITRYKNLEDSLNEKLSEARIMEDQPILIEDKVRRGAADCYQERCLQVVTAAAAAAASVAVPAAPFYAAPGCRFTRRWPATRWRNLLPFLADRPPAPCCLPINRKRPRRSPARRAASSRSAPAAARAARASAPGAAAAAAASASGQRTVSMRCVRLP